jgi:archaeosine-15-forming tRNA-guanine transglycosylase
MRKYPQLLQNYWGNKPNPRIVVGKYVRNFLADGKPVFKPALIRV